MSVILEAHVLDELWHNWKGTQGSAYRSPSYTNEWRAHRRCQEFEDWLFTFGAIVFQQDRQRKLRFDNELDAAAFAMIYLK